MIYLLVFIFGTVIGSFLNVVSIRTLKKESIASPRSHCVKCGTILKPLDLIPVFSYLFLKGKCRYCGEKISPIYLIGELLTGISFVIIYYSFGVSIEALCQILLIVLLIINTLSDIQMMEVHVNLTYALWLLLLGLRFIFLKEVFSFYLLSSLVAYLVLLLIYYIFRGKLGYGDVVIAGLLGVGLGYIDTFTSIFYACVFAIIYCQVLKKKKNEAFPFVPFITLGVLVTYMFNLYNMIY